MGEHYNAGYLAAVKAGTFALRGLLQKVPPWCHPLDSEPGQSWWQGVVDAVQDQFEMHRLQGR